MDKRKQIRTEVMKVYNQEASVDEVVDKLCDLFNVVGQSEQFPICKCENTERVDIGSGSWNIHCKDCGKNW